VRTWLDNWRGVGDVVTGMNRQGYMLHLSNVDASTWWAAFDSHAGAERRWLRDGLTLMASPGYQAEPLPAAVAGYLAPLLESRVVPPSATSRARPCGCLTPARGTGELLSQESRDDTNGQEGDRRRG
jgi:hypothetical protein